MNYIESAGTWSPDGEQFAYVAFKKGKNTLVIKDVTSGNTVEELTFNKIPSFAHPAWSPDGKTIVIAGHVGGQTDLYAIDLRSKKVTQLTDNHYSEILPNWSGDGSKIAFSTDEMSMRTGRRHGAWTFNLAVYNMESGQVEHIDIFRGANNFNPQFDENANLYFVSDRDGYRNMYYYNLTTDEVFQETALATGISGITKYAPAISVSHRRDRILYTYYFNSKYTIHMALAGDLLHEKVDPQQINMKPAELLRLNPRAVDKINHQLNALDTYELMSADSFEREEYKPRFQLDYVGGGISGGVITNSTLGTATGGAGGVEFLFSDILGNNQIYTGVSLNGEIYDIAGVFQYINRKNQLAWGATLSHIPYRTGRYFGVFADTLNIGGAPAQVAREEYELIRIFEDRIGLFAHYPLSVTQRFEVGGSFNYYFQRVERIQNYYPRNGNQVNYGFLIDQDRETVDAPDPFNFFNTNAAFVSDNSFFGLTSPLRGHRYRIGVEKYFGGYTFSSFLADYRRYIFVKPLSFAFRGIHYARYEGFFNISGESPELNEIPLYIIQPYFVRGYSSFSTSELNNRFGLNLEQLLGSKILLGNFEIRLPFTGPRQLSLIPSRFLFSDLALFLDGGIAFDTYDQLGETPSEGSLEPELVMSTGVSLRVNLFGALIIEPFYAIPLKENTKGVFGFNFVPGW